MDIVVKNTRPAKIVLNSPFCELSPGENDVSENVWAKNKKSKAVQMYIELGYLREVPNLPQARPLSEETNIVDLEVLLAKIEKVDRPEQLIKWARTDKRTAVRHAVDKRLEELSKDKKTSDDSDDSDTEVEIRKPVVKRGRGRPRKVAK